MPRKLSADRKAYNREYHRKNRDKRRAYMKANYRANAEERKAKARKYREKYPERVRDAHLRYEYGITTEQYEELLARQGGACAICGSPNAGCSRRENLCVDHCHSTGRIRGLLCVHCNVLIGRYGDRLEMLRLFVEYLESADSGLVVKKLPRQQPRQQPSEPEGDCVQLELGIEQLRGVM